MRSTQKAPQQHQVQTELQARGPDDPRPGPLKSSDRSVLLQAGVARSDDFVSTVTFTNGAYRHPSLASNDLQGTALQLSGSFGSSKGVDDVRPLLSIGEGLSSGEDDGLQSTPSKEGPHGGASLRSAVFNLSTTIVGAGIMALPATIRVLGIIPGVLIILVMGLFSLASVEMVVRYTTHMQAQTYGEMVYATLGKTGGFVSQIAIVVNNGGILIVYMIIMGDVLSGSKNHTGLFEGWTGGDGWWTNRSLVLLLTMIFVLAPLSSLKRMDSLEITSALSLALALVFVLLSSGIAATKLFEGKLNSPRLVPTFGSKKAILDLLTVIPIMTNAFVCQFNVPPIYAELRDRTPARMNKVGLISIGLCVGVYTATALSGYLLFGEATDSDVLSNFDTDLGIPHSRFWNDVIRVGYVVHLFFVFPVIHFSFRETADSLFFPKAGALVDSNLRFGILTFVLLTAIYAGSTLIPNIWIAFQFTGATTALSVGFMFPSVIAIKSKGGGKKEHRLAWGILLMALVVSVVGVTTQIYSFATGDNS